MLTNAVHTDRSRTPEAKAATLARQAQRRAKYAPVTLRHTAPDAWPSRVAR